MGICLDTEPKPLYHSNPRQINGSIERKVSLISMATPYDRNRLGGPLANGRAAAAAGDSGVRQGHGFETPGMPVVFVLGGPGSGKITHSETLVKHHRGEYRHVNMTERMYQILDGTDLNDIAAIPTSQVLDTLMSALVEERKNVYGYVVSGYPRHLRDVAVYLEKIGRCDGVILLNWTLSSLERQIEYGARLGEIDLEMAKVELRNFKKNVIPVAEYFDYKQLLYVISGEREPAPIYNDYLKAFKQILDSDVKIIRPRPQSSGSYRAYRTNDYEDEDDEDEGGGGGLKGYRLDKSASTHDAPKFRKGKPLVIWIIGGPGSEKTHRVEEVAQAHPTWKVISVGKALFRYLGDRHAVAGSGDEATENMVYNLMSRGEMVPQGTILDLVVEEMSQNAKVEGFFITGFPKDIIQAQGFEERTGLKPPCVLIDCSELELGRNLGKRRGRMDDNVEAYKRRLELYRELTLPMLKTFDEQNRLKIVDGDSDHGQVLKELRRCIHREVGALRRERAVESIDENGTTGHDADDGGRAGQDEGGVKVKWTKEFPGAALLEVPVDPSRYWSRRKHRASAYRIAN